VSINTIQDKKQVQNVTRIIVFKEVFTFAKCTRITTLKTVNNTENCCTCLGHLVWSTTPIFIGSICVISRTTKCQTMSIATTVACGFVNVNGSYLSRVQTGAQNVIFW